MHPLHRHHKGRRCTQARGFTLLELTVAMAVFALVAGVVTLTVARAQVVNASTRLEREVRAELEALVARAATAPFADLVGEEFTAPTPQCTTNPRRTCTSVLGRTIEVAWAVSAAADRASLSTENPASVTITATTELPGNLGSVSATRTVTSPNAGRDGTTGLVRIRASGAEYDGPVYLMDSAGEVVGGGELLSGSALLRGDAARCTISDPCTVALSDDGNTLSADVSLDAASAIGKSGAVVLSADAVTDVGIALIPVTTVSLTLQAITPDGRRASPGIGTAGSVCLHLVFYDGTGQQVVPRCNSASADTITWSSYETAPGKFLALPPGRALTVTTDRPDGTCPNIGQKGWNGSAWVSAAVCTSWTWGPVSAIASGGGANTSLVNPSLAPLAAPSSGTAYYRAVWQSAPASVAGSPTSAARPATGFGGETPWSNPRDVPACASTGTCTTLTTDPEASCVTSCASSAREAPELVAPVQIGAWTQHAVAVTAGTRTPFVLSVADHDQAPGTSSDRVSVTVDTTTPGLEVRTATLPTPAYSPVSAGQVVGTNLLDQGSIALAYNAGASIAPGANFTVTLSDGQNSTTRTIWLYNSTSAVTGQALRLTTGQGRSDTLVLTALNAAGNPVTTLAGATTTAPAGVSIGALTSNGDGLFTAPVNVGAVAAGTYPISVTLPSGQAITTTLTVTATLGGLTVTSAVGGGQGTIGSATVSAQDSVGAAMAGVNVAVNVSTASGDPALGVFAVPRGCRTGTDGTCTVALTIETATSAPATLTVTAASNGLVSPGQPIAILPAAARIDVAPVSIAQGGSTQIQATLLDGSGQPVSGATATLGTRPAGLGAGLAGTSNANGEFTINLTAASNAPSGTVLLALSSGNAATEIPITITATATRLSVTSAATVAQGGASAVTVTAYDGTDAPLPGALITITASSPVMSTTSAVTGPGGTATVYLRAGAAAVRGTYPVTFTSGAASASTGVFVTQGVSRVEVEGTLVRGQTANITLILTDTSGNPVSPRAISVTGADGTVTPVRSGTSSAQGTFTAELTASTDAPPGVGILAVSVDGRIVNVGVGIR